MVDYFLISQILSILISPPSPVAAIFFIVTGTILELYTLCYFHEKEISKGGLLRKYSFEIFIINFFIYFIFVETPIIINGIAGILIPPAFEMLLCIAFITILLHFMIMLRDCCVYNKKYCCLKK